MSTKQFIQLLIISFLAVLLPTNADAHKRPDTQGVEATNAASSRSSDCLEGKEEIDLAVNNVRARLRIGGDIWWDGDDGKYIVPKVAVGSGEREVSSLFAGGVWLGGQQLGGDIFVAASEYGQNGKDFYPGPLYDGNNGTVNGETDQATCDKWDKFFVVNGASIDMHIAAFEGSQDFDCASVPLDVKGWPGKGNPHFFGIHGFELPDNDAGLAGFYDFDDNGVYDPCKGDYPIIEIRKCPDPQYADEMIFWIYNDNGNTHNQSEGLPIRMEVQAQAFAYATADEINDMTFYRYKMINRASESIDSFHFSMWIDPDLGCPDDDYIGCDTTEEFMFVYNQDVTDGISGTNCPTPGGEVPTYGTEIPILGVDYFEGPLDEDGNEIGMSSFMYYNRGGTGPPGTLDPTNFIEYFRYLTGTFQDGTPLTVGGDGRTNSGIPTRYAFYSPPNEVGGWSMCEEGLSAGDRRTLQTSGPFRLDPGTNNFLIVGVVWVPDYNYPCPALDRLLEADAVAQNLFDACFDITDGPDAPDIDIIELDKELVLVLSNQEGVSNNYQEQYEEGDLKAPSGVDSLYRFEGYKVFQVFNGQTGDLEDPEYARPIAIFDQRNGVRTLYNWEQLPSPSNDQEVIWIPTLEVEAMDSGVRKTVKVDKDLFATGDNDDLVNNKAYYFTALAYAYNNYKDFEINLDSNEIRGQTEPYLEGRRNVNDRSRDGLPYVGIPRPINDVIMQSEYGEGTQIRMISGSGVSSEFVDITDETRLKMANGSFDGVIEYNPGEAPIEVFIYNPLDVKDGEFELRFLDSNGNDEVDNDDKWELEDLNTGDIYESTNVIGTFNEQIFRSLGISIALINSDDVDDTADKNEGVKRVTGNEIVYENENAEPWFAAVTTNIVDYLAEVDIPFPGFFAPNFDFVDTEESGDDFKFDPEQVLDKVGGGEFVPLQIANFRATNADGPLSYITPQWTRSVAVPERVREQTFGSTYSFNDLPNIDVVMTSNRDLWSRCVVIEGNTRIYKNEGWDSELGQQNWEIRDEPSLLKEVDSNGLPQYDASENGFSWFPGYAVNVETGERLNIFFAENSAYSAVNAIGIPDTNVFQLTGDDMMWNPTTNVIIPPLDDDPNNLTILNVAAGCQHTIYVTNTAYDECTELAAGLSTNNPRTQIQTLSSVQWACMPLVRPSAPLTSYEEGLIPTDVTIKVRVPNPFRKYDLGNSINNDFPVFQFSIDGKEAQTVDHNQDNRVLDAVKAVPNPYYAYSEYEVNEFSNIVKLTNLPPQCQVTIYSLDGKFIRQYDRNVARTAISNPDAGILSKQYVPDIEWDLKNFKGIPISSGVYLIHIDSPDHGEKVIKWFGVNRQFDASGL